ncbi:MAG: site-2 protease family protein, partial [Pseudacidovorax sp.]|nr:site-2 protease family protein [Pseudacidovorax sp.]
MLTLVAFVVALGLLIAVHEYGHYRVAVACNVRVIRFSIGFGPALLRWKPRR